jgi:hypothetical protein
VVCEERKAPAMPLLDLCLIRSGARAGGSPVQLGVPLLDEYLRFLCGRCHPNTVLAAAYDLKVFFTVVGKEPSQVRPADVLGFVTAQRSGASLDRRNADAGRRRLVGRVVAHGAPQVVERVRAVRVPACSR